jgi:hypothetical protein
MPNSYHKHGCWSTISAAEVTVGNQWREPAGYLVLYVLCSVFARMLVKTGWTAETMGDIKVDPWWGTLLSSALISKAAQSFSENRPSS